MQTEGFATPLLSGDDDGLIVDTCWLELGDHGMLLPPAFAIAFDACAYEPQAFPRHGIAFPAAIARAVHKRQAEFLAGRLAAREALARLGVGVAELGKGPLNEPLWPAGVTGSITHTNELGAAIAVASSAVRGIGIDIERRVGSEAGDAIRNVALVREESAVIDAQGAGADEAMLLATVFSAKEAFFKATSTHVGRYFDFHAVRLTHIDTDRGRLAFVVEEPLGTAWQEGQPFHVCFRSIDAQTVVTSFVW